MTPPTSYVVDASVGVKWVLQEPDSDRARALLMERVRGAISVLAPDVYLAEATNVLWKRCRLSGELSPQEAAKGLGFLLLTLPELVPSDSLVTQALELALTFRRPVYDCLYMALALREDCRLVTADERLVRQLAPALGHIVALRDWTG